MLRKFIQNTLHSSVKGALPVPYIINPTENFFLISHKIGHK